jgi:lysyl oxidase
MIDVLPAPEKHQQGEPRNMDISTIVTRSGHTLTAVLLIAAVMQSTAAGVAAQDLPDLTIDAARLKASVIIQKQTFRSGDCAIAEGCVGGTGRRKLLRFDVATPNVGDADLVLGDPAENSAFEFSECHQHFHLDGYARYELVDDRGATIVTGRKQAFCLRDSSAYDPNAGPETYTCDYQGISAGWQDVYGRQLDCQWLDVTDVRPGHYRLRVTINPDGSLTESDYDNNTATVPVTIKK